jgi:hypothetical protein
MGEQLGLPDPASPVDHEQLGVRALQPPTEPIQLVPTVEEARKNTLPMTFLRRKTL